MEISNPTVFVLHLRVTSGFSAQTWQFGFLSFGLQQTNNFFDAAFRLILISLQSSILPFRIFTACSVTRPAQTAFVVAIAKIMLNFGHTITPDYY